MVFFILLLLLLPVWAIASVARPLCYLSKVEMDIDSSMDSPMYLPEPFREDEFSIFESATIGIPD